MSLISVITIYQNRNLQNPDTYRTFRNIILKFLSPSSKNIFKIPNPQGDKFLTRLRLGFSYLREHKFEHSFQDLLNRYVKAVLKLNQLHIFCSTVPFATVKDTPS